MICEKSTTITPVSRCLYCNSVSYGRGCKFAPKGVHFHAGSTKRCSYCGSQSFGRGCKLNPFTDLHLHGIPYNSMISEKLKNTIRNKQLLKELLKPIHEYDAYVLGIIDGNGNKIKEPVTEEEEVAFSPLTRTLLRVKKHLGSKIDLISCASLLECSLHVSYDVVNHKKLLTFESKIKDKINEVFEIIDEALREGVTLDQIDDIIQK